MANNAKHGGVREVTIGEVEVQSAQLYFIEDCGSSPVSLYIAATVVVVIVDVTGFFLF